LIPSCQQNTQIIVNLFFTVNNILDHILSYQRKSTLTEEIIKDVDLMKGKIKTYKKLTEVINTKHKTNFKLSQIKYQANKLLKQTYGNPDNDAFLFVELASDAAKEEGYFFHELNESQQLFRVIYLSSIMKAYSNHFLDIVIVDATYKRNRFNLPLINVIGINNLGHNIMLAFGLLSNETAASYEWFFSHLKIAWGTNRPANFIIDGCEEMKKG